MIESRCEVMSLINVPLFELLEMLYVPPCGWEQTAVCYTGRYFFFNIPEPDLLFFTHSK